MIWYRIDDATNFAQMITFPRKIQAIYKRFHRSITRQRPFIIVILINVRTNRQFMQFGRSLILSSNDLAFRKMCYMNAKLPLSFAAIERWQHHFKLPFACIYSALQFVSNRMRSLSDENGIIYIQSFIPSTLFNRILIKLFISNWLSDIQLSSPRCISTLSKGPTYYNFISKCATHRWAY